MTSGLSQVSLKRTQKMPLYMDMHKGKPGSGVTPEAVAEAHKKDLEVGKQYGVKYEKYYLDPSDGTIFCVVNAPNKEAAIRTHREAHGLVADEIFEVIERK
jgi:hypothetical protein